ncbi:hypothetical protein R3W88_022772 [Solanum pinnatisectum]|uniref:Retrotransposon gag domain-containing protein n=1 Tax=Solanum pinnatisectum TaxID=50273 RepID=A0AAV9LYY3_9SOLN|nr:hypothetical protein R3W88_022772 [Solanum pinnatisectum]
MDSTINTVASFEMIATPSVAANPSASVATKSPIEVIARLEQQIGELNLLVTQYQASSQNLPLDARQKRPMPPLFPTSSELNQGDHFTTFQQTQTPTVTHHAPLVYTYVIAQPVTKAQEFHRQDVNYYVEIENDAKSIYSKMMNKKMKSLEDAMRGLRGQSVRYKELCTFPEVDLPPSYKIPKFEKFSGPGDPFFHFKIYCEKLIGVGNNKGIRIKLFNQSLTGKALEWYSKQDVTKWRTWDDLANAFTQTQLFDRLKEAGILHPVEAKTVNTSAEWYDPNKRCAYHSGVVGYDTEKCITLKHKIQDLIDNEVAKLAQAPPNVNTNPLPKHKE